MHLIACLFLSALFAGISLLPDDRPQLLHELALDQAEFNQSLPEIASLKNLDPLIANHDLSP